MTRATVGPEIGEYGTCVEGNSCPLPSPQPTPAPVPHLYQCREDTESCVVSCDGDNRECTWDFVCGGEDGYDCYCEDGNYYAGTSCPTASTGVRRPRVTRVELVLVAGAAWHTRE